MKKLAVLLVLTFFVVGCGDNNPTEIIVDSRQNDDFDIELLSKTPDDYLYSGGIDSTGNNPDRGYGAHFSINIIKNSFDKVTLYSVLAQGVFNNLDSPSFSPDGRFLGYNTFDVRRVTFNNYHAMERPLVKRYLAGQIIRDTVLGPSYYYGRRNLRNVLNPVFDFGETVDINVIQNDFSVEHASIVIPPDMNGSVTTAGSNSNDFSALLNWNGLNQDKIQIILYGVALNSDIKYPLFRIRTTDDGELRLPNKLFRNLPFGRFRSFVFTFLRETKTGQNGTGDDGFYIAANSIHNIGVPLNE